jgi:catechol 2,3-dioxygenase-like lactoylglutathione lyase family enzyme
MHHLGLTVADLERSIRFYRDLLGLTLVRRRPGVDADYAGLPTGFPGVVLDFDPDEYTLELFQPLQGGAG